MCMTCTELLFYIIMYIHLSNGVLLDECMWDEITSIFISKIKGVLFIKLKLSHAKVWISQRRGGSLQLEQVEALKELFKWHQQISLILNQIVNMCQPDRGKLSITYLAFVVICTVTLWLHLQLLLAYWIMKSLIIPLYINMQMIHFIILMKPLPIRMQKMQVTII